MDVISKQVVLDDHPLFLRARPVLLHLFGRGVQTTDAKWILMSSIMSIAMLPLSWVFMVFVKSIHIGILLIAWWFLKDYLNEFGSLHYVLLAIGLVAIFYKGVYDDLIQLFFDILVIITWGGFMRWICRGYLPGNPFRQKMLISKPIETFIASPAASIPNEFRMQYDEIMDLLLDINQPGNEEILSQLLDGYEQNGLP